VIEQTVRETLQKASAFGIPGRGDGPSTSSSIVRDARQLAALLAFLITSPESGLVFCCRFGFCEAVLRDGDLQQKQHYSDLIVVVSRSVDFVPHGYLTVASFPRVKEGALKRFAAFGVQSQQNSLKASQAHLGIFGNVPGNCEVTWRNCIHL